MGPEKRELVCNYANIGFKVDMSTLRQGYKPTNQLGPTIENYTLYTMFLVNVRYH
jgi:hypothetical protein